MIFSPHPIKREIKAFGSAPYPFLISRTGRRRSGKFFMICRKFGFVAQKELEKLTFTEENFQDFPLNLNDVPI